MDPALWAVVGAGAALLLVLVGVALATALGSRRARTRDDAARAEVEALRRRVEELDSELAATRGPAAAVPTQTDYVITTAGDRSVELRPDLPPVSERAVLSVTVGEPLVRLAALGYGLRKALSPQTRNRIAFEMRREVKRARKARRRAARRARVAPSHAEEAA